MRGLGWMIHRRFTDTDKISVFVTKEENPSQVIIMKPVR